MLDRDEQLKVSSVGIKLFERQEAKVCHTLPSHACITASAIQTAGPSPLFAHLQRA